MLSSWAYSTVLSRDVEMAGRTLTIRRAGDRENIICLRCSECKFFLVVFVAGIIEDSQKQKDLTTVTPSTHCTFG
jgi:hypothetical protein